MFNTLYIVITIYAKDKIIIYARKKADRKIIICDVSAYNTHPDLRLDFQRKKCVLYAENYGSQNALV